MGKQLQNTTVAFNSMKICTGFYAQNVIEYAGKFERNCVFYEKQFTSLLICKNLHPISLGILTEASDMHFVSQIHSIVGSNLVRGIDIYVRFTSSRVVQYTAPFLTLCGSCSGM
jgi:hypothetical protein